MQQFECKKQNAREIKLQIKFQELNIMVQKS